MMRSGLALAAGALALVAASAFDAAEAHKRGGGARAFHGGHHARGFSHRGFHGHRLHGGHIHRHRFGRHFRRGIIIGAPIGVYGAYAYTASCDWYYRKAIITGSGYWWYRYELCLDGL